MTDWKTKLYESYVSTHQSSAGSKKIENLQLSQFPQFQHIIKTYVPCDKKIRIVDLGCGYGQMVFCLEELGYKNVNGVDISPEQVKVAQQIGLKNVQQGDLIEYLQNKSCDYDVIFLMDILEHLEKQDVFDLLELTHKSIKDNGRVIMHVPNADGLFGMRVRYGDFTHEVCFTPKSIKQVLMAAGFRNISVYEQKPLVHGIKSLVRRVLWSVLTTRDRLLLLAETGVGNHILSQNMLVIADK